MSSAAWPCHEESFPISSRSTFSSRKPPRVIHGPNPGWAADSCLASSPSSQRKSHTGSPPMSGCSFFVSILPKLEDGSLLRYSASACPAGRRSSHQFCIQVRVIIHELAAVVTPRCPSNQRSCARHWIRRGSFVHVSLRAPAWLLGTIQRRFAISPGLGVFHRRIAVPHYHRSRCHRNTRRPSHIIDPVAEMQQLLTDVLHSCNVEVFVCWVI